MRPALAAAAVLLALTGVARAFDTQSFDAIERGRYLAVLGDCRACHTAPGGQPFAGGLRLETPFGILVTPNITPDPATGIGTWSEEDFVRAVREGRGHDGVRLYPAMPYPAYTRLSDRDVHDLYAFIASLEPVSNAVSVNQLPFPLNIRAVMIVWNWLNFAPERFVPDPQKSAEWNRGAYLVQGPGHCGTCHTPKTLLGADKSTVPLAGNAIQGWFAPNITPDPRKGIGRWSKDDIVEYLKTGGNRWTLSSGPMSDAVAHSTSLMSEQDVAAIATYLKDSGAGPPPPSPTPVGPQTAAMHAGQAIFKDSCAACHKDDGSGEKQLFPTLAGSALVQSDDATTLVRLVLQGSRAVATDARPTGPAMPAFDWRLNDQQIADVLTFIRNSWGNAATAVPPGKVAAQRAALAKAP